MDSCWCQQNTLANSVTALLTGRAILSDVDDLHTSTMQLCRWNWESLTPCAINLGHIQSYANTLEMKVTITSSGDKDEVDTGMQMF